MLKHMPSGPANGSSVAAAAAAASAAVSATNNHNRGQTVARAHNRSIQQPLNVSTISNNPGQLSIVPFGQPPPLPPPQQQQQQQQQKLLANGGPRNPLLSSSILNTTPMTSISSATNINNNNNNNNNNYNNNPNNPNNGNVVLSTKHHIGAREALTSLGLLCLVSLLLALLSLIFLLKISPGGREPPPPPPGPISSEDYIIVYDVTLALCALSLSLNLCCLLVCAIQFLFAVKLVRAPATPGRGNKYLQKSSVSRVCAVGGFFISIPIFLTGIILYTFTQFHSTPAIITSVLIGIGIVFCGCAMVHNVFVWQKEKTICVRQNPINLNLSLHAPISTITTPSVPQFLNHNGTTHNGHLHGPSSHMHVNNIAAYNANHNHTPLTHISQMSHQTLTPVTPLSPNHSHVSFNHSYVPTTYAIGGGGSGLRAASATPPTPKVMSNGAVASGVGGTSNSTVTGVGRDVSGSVSPGMPNGTLELSNVTTTNSPHELSTLV